MTRIRLASPVAGARLLGLGSFQPEHAVSNDDLAQTMDTNDQWIRERVGIQSRRVADKDTLLVDMASDAGARAVKDSGLTPAEIDTVIVATCTMPNFIPNAAAQTAERIGIPAPGAFDLNAACAGFCFGIGTAADLVRAGTAKNALVIGAEKLSDWLDWTDRSTAIIFADGAGAAVVGPSDEVGIGPVVWGSDGEQYDLIRQDEDWRDVLVQENPTMPHLIMQGAAVFRWASFAMAKIAEATLDKAGITVDDLDVFVPHQANMRIIDAMARSMKLPEHVAIARDIAEQGNTSAASIPLALGRMIDEGTAKSGDTALLIAFGAGLAYAAQVIIVP
jgi:3-oxoacyl-[acyl-carrier-protein] synthase III